MITSTDIRNVDHVAYDAVWGIVQSLKNKADYMEHVPELSPSWNLFKKYLQLRDSDRWNEEMFQNIYVPIFLREMQSGSARKKLNGLVWLDWNEKHVCLVCFCHDETLCHRSIIAGILQQVGVSVSGVKGDHSRYDKEYEQSIKR